MRAFTEETGRTRRSAREAVQFNTVPNDGNKIKPIEPKPIKEVFNKDKYEELYRPEVSPDVNKFYQKLSEDEKESILKYDRNWKGSTSMNKSLYTGEYEKQKFNINKLELNKDIDNLSDIIQKGSLPKDIKLVRNVDSNFIDAFFKKLNIDVPINLSSINKEDFESVSQNISKQIFGVEYEHKSFMSTSFDIKSNVFDKREYTLDIFADKGTKALITNNWDESEIIFDKGTKLEILGVRFQEAREAGQQGMFEFYDEGAPQKMIIETRIIK